MVEHRSPKPGVGDVYKRQSLTLPKEEVDALIAAGKQYVVRFKIEPNEDVHVNDLIRGEVVINSCLLYTSRCV